MLKQITIEESLGVGRKKHAASRGFLATARLRANVIHVQRYGLGLYGILARNDTSDMKPSCR